jgi:hypothetical protein
VPINDFDEIDDDFCGWERLTDKNEIWHWFDEQYARWGGVHALMFPDEHKKSKFGEVRAEVHLQEWLHDYAITIDTVEFDCARALDMLPIERVRRLETGAADCATDEVFAEAVIMNLVKDHDGPFDCYICDDAELADYIKAREEG